MYENEMECVFVFLSGSPREFNVVGQPSSVIGSSELGEPLSPPAQISFLRNEHVTQFLAQLNH